MIIVNGKVIAQGSQFSLNDVEYVKLSPCSHNFWEPNYPGVFFGSSAPKQSEISLENTILIYL
jgi:hypothetical protein